MDKEKLKSIITNAETNNSGEVEITQNYTFNQEDTINLITLYTASKFQTGDIDPYTKQKKYFFNIVNSACMNVTKNIDIDTKNINIKAKKLKDRDRAMVFNQMLKKYFKEDGFGTLLNKSAESLPKYGSIIWKWENNGLKLLNINNCLFEPGVNCVDNDYHIRSSYFIEKHYVQPDELKKMTIKGWKKDAVEKVLNAFKLAKINNKKVGDILVYELHQNLPDSWLADKEVPIENDTWNFYRIYMVTETSGLDVNEVLYYNIEKEMPYSMMSYRIIEGRSLGLGVVEELFDAQMRMNEMKNQKASAMLLGAKTIFTTADDTIEKNVVKQMLNGDIIKARSGLVPVQTDTKNLGAYQQEEASWMDNARALSNRLESLTGENMPTNTPYKSLQRLNLEGSKFFDFVRENFGLFIKYNLEKFVLPQAKKAFKKWEIFDLFDLDVIAQIYENRINKEIEKAYYDTIDKYGVVPTADDIAIAKKAWMERKPTQLTINIDDELLTFDYTLDIDITGESIVDNLDNKINLIQSLSQNAQALQDPNIKNLYDSAAEDMGVDKNLVKF